MNRYFTVLLLITLISVCSCQKTEKIYPDKPKTKSVPWEKKPCHCGYGGFCPSKSNPKEGCFCKLLSAPMYKFCEHCDVYAECKLSSACDDRPCPYGTECFNSFGSFYCNCDEDLRSQKCDAEFKGDSKCTSFFRTFSFLNKTY